MKTEDEDNQDINKHSDDIFLKNTQVYSKTITSSELTQKLKFVYIKVPKDSLIN